MLQGPGEPSQQGAGKRRVSSDSGDTQRQQSELRVEQRQHLGTGSGSGQAEGTSSSRMARKGVTGDEILVLGLEGVFLQVAGERM